MLTLLNIFESEYKQIIIPKSPKEFYDYLNSVDGAYDIILNNIFSEEDIKKLFDYAESLKSNGNKKAMPFVCNYKNNTGFVVRRYAVRVLKKNEDDYNNLVHKSKLKRIYFFKGLHTTSYNDDGTQSIRSYNGLQKEDDDLSDLLKFVSKISEEYSYILNVNYDDLTNLSIQNLNELFDDEIGNFKRFYGMYHAGIFSPLINKMLNDNTFDPSKIIIKTGTEDTKRNKNNVIFTSDCKFGEGITDLFDEYLENSGAIISDITIKNSLLDSKLNDVYISCKMESAQMSGISLEKAMKVNKEFKNGIDNNKDFSELNGNDIQIFINFWDLFGINAKDIYDIYKNNKNNMLNNINDDSSNAYEIKNFTQKNQLLLGRLIKMIIGGNYWLLKGTYDAKFLTVNSKDILFNIKRVYITKSGKTINIVGELTGKLNDLDSEVTLDNTDNNATIKQTTTKPVSCKFTFRTSGNSSRFPYRIFIDNLDLNKLNEITDLYSITVK